MDPLEARRARAAARSGIPIRRVPLAEESSPDVSSLSIEARIALVWEVTLDAWVSSDRPLPDYDRANAPGRVLRGARDAT